MQSAFSDALIAAWKQQGNFTPHAAPQSQSEAYAIHRAALAQLGPAGAYKIGRPAGGQAFIAPIPADRCFAPGAKVAVPQSVGLELELGWYFTASPEKGAAPIEYIRPICAVELVASRAIGPLAADPLVKLADFQASNGLVMGQPFMDWDGTDFSQISGGLTLEGQGLTPAALQVPGGSALETLAVFLEMTAALNIAVTPGMVLITGTTHPLFYTEMRGALCAQINALAPISFDLN